MRYYNDYEDSGRKFVDEYFDDFLNDNAYFKEVYFHLIQFEQHFSVSLREFIIQAHSASQTTADFLILSKKSFATVDAVKDLINNNLHPFERLLTTWIIADYLWVYRESYPKKLTTFHKYVGNFHTTAREIVKRDTKFLLLRIVFNEEVFQFDIEGEYINGSWKVVEQLEIKEPKQATPVEPREEAEPTNNQLKKLKWTGTPSQFGFIIDLLIQGGYIKKPTTSFAKDANIYLSLFDIDTTVATLTKEVSENTNNLEATNRIKFKIPLKSDLTSRDKTKEETE